ncbi:MAG TPA: EAL domain-containing protein [Xanthobacteraceae bacterium]|jgi:diguanylate cyclase (GGDEF)-like protein
MFRVLSCLDGQHDLRLVLLAVIVCFVTCLVAVNLIHRARQTHHRARLAWIIAAGAASGCGIWATHFIAMLAYEPGVPIAYDLPLTMLSFAVAWGLMSAGIALTISRANMKSALLGGCVVGLAITLMHFVGMQALQVPGHLTWSPDLVAVAIVFATVFGMAAMETARRTDVAMMLLAAVTLSAAIILLHFTAMGAIEIVPDPTRSVTPFSVSPSVLALYIAGATALVLAVGFAGSIIDRRIGEKTELLEAALQNMFQGLCMLNGKQEVMVVNDRFLEMFGIAPRQVRPLMPALELMDAAEQSVPFGAETLLNMRRWWIRLMREKKSGKAIFQRTDGRIYSVSHRHMPAMDGWVDTFEDITERRNAEEKIAHMARHDTLTGLPNRMHFRERFDKAVAAIDRTGAFAVLCLDLDNFKIVNDTLGHQAGDALLQIAAKRIQTALRKNDLAARIGGDEFAILQLTNDQPSAAIALASRLVEIMQEPIVIGDQEVPVGVSVGIAQAPADGSDADTLLKNADLALYRSKADGRGTYCLFTPQMHVTMQARRVLELDLRSSLSADAFELFYQPIVNIANNKVTSFEALLRWHHPQRGLLSPAEFIPLAEKTGLIVPLGEWVLREACSQAAKWPDDVHVAVNLSPAQLKSANFLGSVLIALSSAQLSPKRLELEITESVLLQDSAAATATLRQLRELGVKISMDDFGTGYSSLSYLRKFPFDKIKIDQSFIRDLANGGDSLAIVHAVTGLGNSLGISTIAEGVETAEQLDRLKEAGCTEAQGYFFGAPKPLNEAIRHLGGSRRLRVVA